MLFVFFNPFEVLLAVFLLVRTHLVFIAFVPFLVVFPILGCIVRVGHHPLKSVVKHTVYVLLVALLSASLAVSIQTVSSRSVAVELALVKVSSAFRAMAQQCCLFHIASGSSALSPPLAGVESRGESENVIEPVRIPRRSSPLVIPVQLDYLFHRTSLCAADRTSLSDAPSLW